MAKEKDWFSHGANIFASSEEELLDWTKSAKKIKDTIDKSNDIVNETAEREISNISGRHGYVAEDIIAESANINAVKSGLETNTETPPPNSKGEYEYASPDIITGDSNPASSKYFNSAKASLDAQLESDKNNPDLNKYDGQQKIIPSDQIIEAHNQLDRYIEVAEQSESGNIYINQKTGEVSLDRLLEAKNTLSDQYIRPDGITAQSPTYDEAIQASKGEDYFEQMHSSIDHLENIAESSAQGAAIGLALRTAPKVLGGLHKCFSDPSYNLNQYGADMVEFFKSDGKDIAIDSAIKASTAGVLTSAIHSSNIGEPFSNLGAVEIGGIAVVGVEATKSFIKWQKGEITGEEAMYKTTKSGIAVTGATIGQSVIPIPVVGAMIGSFIASQIIARGEESIRIQKAILSQYDDFAMKQERLFKAMFSTALDYREISDNYEKLIAGNKNMEDSNEDILKGISEIKNMKKREK